MAVPAALETDLVAGLVPRRRVALLAGHQRVPSSEWVLRLLVRGQGEGCGFPAVHRVAGAALAAAGAGGELPLVRVGVAVQTARVRYRLREIGGPVTAPAGYSNVLSGQRELGPQMIKLLGHPRRAPGVIAVAGRARDGEGATMRVLMAWRATGERQAGELRPLHSIARSRMALRAFDSPVRAGKLKTRGAVVEAWRGLPCREGMALRAPGAELAPVLVGVAAQALARKPEIRPAEISDDDAAPFNSGNASGRMTLPALQAPVPALERVTRLAVIEFGKIDVPANRNEALAVVFGMTADALLLVSHRQRQRGVEPAALRQTRPNLGVATEALERARTCPNRVAGGAPGRPLQRAMRLRQRAGRELRPGTRHRPRAQREDVTAPQHRLCCRRASKK